MALVDQNSLSATEAFQVRVMMAVVNYCQGTVLAEATNEVQSVSIGGGTPSSGAFILSAGPLLSNQVTVVFNDTAAGVQAKIQAVLGTGETCICLGGPLPGSPISVTFTGSLAYLPQVLMTQSGSTLNVGTPAVARTTAGVGAFRHSDRLKLAGLILESPEKYKLRFTQMVTTDTTVMSDYTGGGNLQTAVTDAHIATAVGNVYNSFLGA